MKTCIFSLSAAIGAFTIALACCGRHPSNNKNRTNMPQTKTTSNSSIFLKNSNPYSGLKSDVGLIINEITRDSFSVPKSDLPELASTELERYFRKLIKEKGIVLQPDETDIRFSSIDYLDQRVLVVEFRRSEVSKTFRGGSLEVRISVDSPENYIIMKTD